MAGIQIDLRKLLPKRGADAAGRVARLAENVTSTLEHATDRVVAPHADGRVPARRSRCSSALATRSPWTGSGH